MNEMKAVMSLIFRVLKFPRQGMIVTIDQLFYCVPNPSSKYGMNVPFIGDFSVSFESVGVGMFKDSSLMGTFSFPPPINYVASSPV